MKQINKIILFLAFLFLVTLVNAQEIKKWKLDDLEMAIKNSDKPTIINFWATFCIPCIEELPYFQKAAKKYDSAGVQLILVSLDMKAAYPKKISVFAAKNKIVAPIFFFR